METNNQGCSSIKAKWSTRTALVTLIPGALEIVKKIAIQNKIRYEYIGMDQNENTVLRLIYNIRDQSVINAIYAYIRFFEGLLAGLKALAEPALQLINDELVIAYQKLKAEKEQKDAQLKIVHNSTNTIDNGNQGRE